MILIGIHEIKYAMTLCQIFILYIFPNNVGQVKWKYFDIVNYLIPGISWVNFRDRAEKSQCVSQSRHCF